MNMLEIHSNDMSRNQKLRLACKMDMKYPNILCGTYIVTLKSPRAWVWQDAERSPSRRLERKEKRDLDLRIFYSPATAAAANTSTKTTTTTITIPGTYPEEETMTRERKKK
jgi:hypothetical protein